MLPVEPYRERGAAGFFGTPGGRRTTRRRDGRESDALAGRAAIADDRLVLDSFEHPLLVAQVLAAGGQNASVHGCGLLEEVPLGV